MKVPDPQPKIKYIIIINEKYVSKNNGTYDR